MDYCVSISALSSYVYALHTSLSTDCPALLQAFYSHDLKYHATSYRPHKRTPSLIVQGVVVAGDNFVIHVLTYHVQWSLCVHQYTTDQGTGRKWLATVCIIWYPYHLAGRIHHKLLVASTANDWWTSGVDSVEPHGDFTNKHIALMRPPPNVAFPACWFHKPVECMARIMGLPADTLWFTYNIDMACMETRPLAHVMQQHACTPFCVVDEGFTSPTLKTCRWTLVVRNVGELVSINGLTGPTIENFLFKCHATRGTLHDQHKCFND